MGKVFAVTSGKGGAGKSTVSIGLGFAFSRMGKSVLLVDMDEGLRCLDLMLGIDENTLLDLSDILKDRDISDALYDIPNYAGLKLIPAPLECGRIDPFALSKTAAALCQKFDIVIFDFPAGIDFSLYTAMPEKTLFLTVTSPDPVSIRDARAVSDRLLHISRQSRLIINNFKASVIKKGFFSNIDDIIDTSSLQLIGIIPYDEELGFLSVTHRLKPRGRAMGAFDRIAARLEGKSVKLPSYKKI